MLIINIDQLNAINVIAYVSRTREASAFAQAVSDRSALRNLALAFAENVGTNLVGELPVSAIVQMIAGNLVEVKELGMGRLRRWRAQSYITRALGIIVHKPSGDRANIMVLGCASKQMR
jgi:hypothetical protein